MLRTEVDILMQLLQERKQMSLDDMAKAVKLPRRTVEALALLLEEENMIHITHKFFTPYLNFGPPRFALAAEKKDENPDVTTPAPKPDALAEKPIMKVKTQRHIFSQVLTVIMFVGFIAATMFMLLVQHPFYYFPLSAAGLVVLVVYKGAMWPEKAPANQKL